MFVPLTFDQTFRPFLQELARFETTRELEDSVVYRKLKAEIELALSHVWHEELSSTPPAAASTIRAVSWNIERGIQVDAVRRLLTEHPALLNADVLLLSELDWGMARTSNRFVARDIASTLGMNYAFAPCYLALTKGAGVEKNVEGENLESLHGNALLCKHPMRGVHSLALPNGKDKMQGAEKRIGSQRAVIADIEHPLGALRAVSLHLDAHSSQRHRWLQMRQVLDHLDTLNPKLPVLIGGDWNTTTHNASRALFCILGYFRRVLMGVRHVVSNHYPFPERWFERRLFRELVNRGYTFKDMNQAGECTLHYNIRDMATNLNLAEWVPNWCFWFVNWALERTGGGCSMKLDWFAGKGLRPSGDAVVVHDLKNSGLRVSDHDPIAVSFSIAPR